MDIKNIIRKLKIKSLSPESSISISEDEYALISYLDDLFIDFKDNCIVYYNENKSFKTHITIQPNTIVKYVHFSIQKELRISSKIANDIDEKYKKKNISLKDKTFELLKEYFKYRKNIEINLLTFSFLNY